MDRFVIDVSVIMKWVIGNAEEPDQQIAISLLKTWVANEVELFAPALWEYEAGNFLGRELPQEARDKMQHLLNLNIATVDLSFEMFQNCFEWMAKKTVTFYDASYLAVALERQAILVTADAKFVEKMGKEYPVCQLKKLYISST